MDRTYNVFVDNGLFILANCLNKNFNEVTEEDIEDNIELMCNKIIEFTNCKKYSNLKSMVFPNSPLTQRNGNLGCKVREVLRYKGDDICCRCGKKKASIINNINKTYIPNIISLTMYNYSNNLQGVNICPHCFILSVYSVLNCRVVKDVILYNSSNDSFMEDYTEEIKNERDNDIYWNADKDNKTTRVTLIEKMWNINNNRNFDGYLEQVSFNNIGLGMPHYEVKTLDDKNIKLFNKLKIEGLWDEFINKDYKFLNKMLDGNLESNYASSLIKWNNEKSRYEIICSKKLLDFLNREVNRLNKKTMELLDRIVEAICKLNKVEISYKKLKNLQEGTSYFEDFLVDILCCYKEIDGETLFNSDELLILTNRMKYRQIKNLLIVKLVEKI